MLNISLNDYTKDPLFIGVPRNLMKQISHQLLIALKYLRDMRIIHGNLKPENILFTDESQLNVKIIEFGIAQPETK